MWMKIRTAAIVALISSGTATVAFAQGSMTQDPGRMAPGNLTIDHLGPSTGSPAVGGGGPEAGAMPNGNWSGTSQNIPRGSAASAGSAGTTVFHAHRVPMAPQSHLGRLVRLPFLPRAAGAPNLS